MRNKKFSCSQGEKNNFVFIAFVFFFSISFSIIFKRHFEPKASVPSFPLTTIAAVTEFSSKHEKPDTGKNYVNELNTINHILNVLHNTLPLSSLKTYLQG